MEKVWNEIQSRANKLKPGARDTAYERFFFAAFDCACHPRSLTSAREREAHAARFSAAAEVIRSIGNKGEADRIDAIVAAEQNRRTNVSFKEDFRRGHELVVVKKHNDNDPARAYVILLASVPRELFGDFLYGTIATTASVALNCEITKDTVRSWVDQ